MASRTPCAPTSSTASRRSSWSPLRSPRWRCSSCCACPSSHCRPPTTSPREGQMTSNFSTAVALRSEQSGGALSVTDNTLPARWDGPPLPRPPPPARRGGRPGGPLPGPPTPRPPGGAAPPLHHHEFDEAFYVLDGEITFQVRDELFTAGPGAVAFAPGGVAHTLANLGDAPARYVLLCTPAGFEAYFGRLAAEAAGEDPPAWALAPTPPVTTVGGQIGERGDVAAVTPIAPAGDHFNVVVHGEQNDG